MNSIKISISAPCHENWAAMSPTDKGRFCGSCQKQVMDFTKASDRQIAESYKTEKHLCGRFLVTQLDRNLVVPKEKSTMWAAASALVISFFVLGSQKAIAQGKPVKTEVSPSKPVQKQTLQIWKKAVTGTVAYKLDNFPIAGVYVVNTTNNDTVITDVEGKFAIEAAVNDTLVVSFISMEDYVLKVGADNYYDIFLNENQNQGEEILMMAGGISSPSFFRRVWYSITRILR